MLQSEVPHFQESGRTHTINPDAHMPEAVYSTALDYLVFTCVDIVFTHHDQGLLAKRNQYPRASWWIVGGRMAAGEQPRDTAIRKADREAGLKGLAASRFCYVGAYSTCFAKRHQLPKHHGSHSLNLTYQIELTQVEKEQLTLRSDEYDHWEWMTVGQITTLLNDSDPIDQALLQVVQDSFRPITRAQT